MFTNNRAFNELLHLITGSVSWIDDLVLIPEKWVHMTSHEVTYKIHILNITEGSQSIHKIVQREAYALKFNE